MSDRPSFWPAVLSFAGGMAACGLAMYMVNKLSDKTLQVDEDEDDYLLQADADVEEDFDVEMDFPHHDEDLDLFDIDEMDVQDLEGLSMAMARGIGNDVSSDENSQTENNKHGRGVLATRGKTSCGLSWTQTHEEVVLEFHVPTHVKAKDIQCKFNTNSISVQVQGDTLLEGGLHMPIQPDGCSWEIDNSGQARVLLVSLLKSPLSPGFWTEVMKTDANGADESEK